MKGYKQLYFWSFLLIFLSCVKEDTIKIKIGEPKLVLNAGIKPGQEITAFLTQSAAAGSSLQDLELKTPPTIRVYINNEFKGNMITEKEEETDGYYGELIKGLYSLPEIKPATGDRVRLEAEAIGFETVSAEIKIPEAPEMLLVDTVRYLSGYSNQEKMRLYIKLKDKPQENNYYRAILKSQMSDEGDGSVTPRTNQFYEEYVYDYGSYNVMVDYEDIVFTTDLPMHILNGSRQNYYGIFSDNLFNGKEYILRLSFSTYFYNYTTKEEDNKAKYRLRLISITEDYYNYYKQSNLLSFSVGSIQLAPSREFLNTYSNVNNGFGLVFAYNESIQDIIVNRNLMEDGEE